MNLCGRLRQEGYKFNIILTTLWVQGQQGQVIETISQKKIKNKADVCTSVVEYLPSKHTDPYLQKEEAEVSLI